MSFVLPPADAGRQMSLEGHLMVSGALTTIVTPFRDSGVDQQALCELVEFHGLGQVRVPLMPGTRDDCVQCTAARNFCDPAIRGGVKFQDMTDDGYLRHAGFRRFADQLISSF